MMKKVSILLIIISIILLPINTFAKDANTLNELKEQLNAFKSKQQVARDKKNQSQSQINQNKNDVYKKQKEVEDNKLRIEEAKKNIVVLEEDIDKTKEKMEETLRSYEKSSGDSIYLEYIFGASSISDFIIRYSLASQIADYNDELINEYKNKLEETKELKEDLAKREGELNTQIKELQASIDKLGEEVKDYDEVALSYNDQISSTEKLIKYYQSIGCSGNQSFDSCISAYNRRNSSSGSVVTPSATGFLKPLNRGVVTSYFGYRYHPVTGVYKLHSGVDIGGNSEGTSVYPVASGMVGKIIYRASCGGNQVFVYHTVNGKKYTSVYMHLLSINVSVGQTVSAYTSVGTVGGATTYYDSCSTGAHLHLSMATGWYGSSYVDYSTYVARLFDPRTFLGIPSMGTWFYSR